MTHEWKWGRLLRRHRDGELNPSDAERWKLHRAGCRRCRSDETALDELETALRSARPEPVALEPEEADRILQAALVQSGALRRRSPWLFPMWGIATVIVCTVAVRIALLTGERSRPTRAIAHAGPLVVPLINRSRSSAQASVLPAPAVLPKVTTEPTAHPWARHLQRSRQVRLARADEGRRSTALSGLRATTASASALRATVLLAGIHYQPMPRPIPAASSTAEHATVLMAGIHYRPASRQLPVEEVLPQIEPLTSPLQVAARLGDAAVVEPAVLFVAVTDVPHSPVALTVRDTPAEQPGMARASATSGTADGGWLLTEVTVSSEQDSPTLVMRSISPPSLR